MRHAASLILLLACVASAGAQSRTPWGDPDLQGVWSNQNPTPFERPDALKGKSTLTAAEAAEFEKTALDLYEVGCHEGNIGLRGILAGARAEESGR